MHRERRVARDLGVTRKGELAGVEVGEDVAVPDQHRARAEERPGRRDAARRAEQLGLVRDRDVLALGPRANVVRTVMNVDHDARRRRETNPRDDVRDGRQVADRHHGLGDLVGERAQARPETGAEHHRRIHPARSDHRSRSYHTGAIRSTCARTPSSS